MQTRGYLESQVIRLTATFAALGLLGSINAASGDETEALISRLGHGCKIRVMKRFDATDADINVRLSASLRQDLDTGATPATELEAYGASFDWTVRGTGANGYCNVDGSGRVTEFVQW
jgi:hypothetical protein